MSTTQEIEMQTFTRSGYLNKALYIYVAAIVFYAGFFKIADLDFWWHLQTGKSSGKRKRFNTLKSTVSLRRDGPTWIMNGCFS